ncbi:hypothetical protein LINPERPRIM_LOCUS14819 [Linum perenne]
MLLSAIGKDGNNQIFPLAWAVTEGETTSNWKWFVELVVEQLRLDQGNGWTVISDQQKVSSYSLACTHVNLYFHDLCSVCISV